MTHSGFPTTFTIILTSDHFYNYNLPWIMVSFKTVCRYSFKRWSIRAIQSIFVSSSSLTPFKVIPDPFQSLNTKGSIFKVTIPDPFQNLNTKGSIFKVSLQTYIYIIVIYTTTNKFVWTRMLIFLSN
ncbi:hypothetical protein DVH24_040790 [Malus domestica]|uniref:Uncharacterized protein n=1 Tax=Malus domestica TaxID=3750 RepID=A0A498IEL1_MALDO|nr:hypothetical protein DVH24_040790 [Malus domestica]